ncbi:MAG: hypothetical protein IKU24_03770 [Clostridia bacterium]|nr:hypothetical protein [Clostridia bacterium]
MSIVFNFFLLKFGGTTAVAAFSVIMYVDSFVGMFLFGMTDSLQPAISYCFGAKLMDRAKVIFRRILLGAVVLSIASLIFMMFFGPKVAPLFIKNNDVQLYNVSVVGMKLFSISYLFGWVDMCFSSYFTALEKPIQSMLISLFGTLFFPILSLIILTPALKLNGVWISPIVSCFSSAIFTLIIYLNTKIKKSAPKTQIIFKKINFFSKIY